MTEQWADELGVFTRAFAGAAVFGIPLAMTMEMWWIGKTLAFPHLIVILIAGFVANLGLVSVAGFRNDNSRVMNIDQAIDSLVVGLVSAAVLLIAFNQLRFTDGLGHGIGMVILLSIPMSLGTSVAREVFSGHDSRTGEDGNTLSPWQGVIADVGATAIGGLFIGISIAPTDEVAMIAAGITRWHLVGIVGLSLLLTYLIVFASGFDETSPPGPFQIPINETILAYLVSLLVAFGLLLLFERIALDDPLTLIIRQTVVLALPAAIGGAAGRLVV